MMIKNGLHLTQPQHPEPKPPVPKFNINKNNTKWNQNLENLTDFNNYMRQIYQDNPYWDVHQQLNILYPKLPLKNKQITLAYIRQRL